MVRGRSRAALAALAVLAGLALPSGPAGAAAGAAAGAGAGPAGAAGAAGPGGDGSAPISLVDDTGASIRLERLPRRIVSLAPHATELLFAAGLGGQVVAVDPDSDHPPEARGLPKVGALPEPAVERLLAMRPDLVVAWAPAVRPGFVERMARLGVSVFVSDPRTLDSIAGSLARFARLAPDGGAAGRAAAGRFAAELSALRARWSGSAALPVFVQVWGNPLITISDRDVIGDAIAACGGVNLAGSLPDAAPRIDVERVLAARPALVVATDSPGSIARWRQLGLVEPAGPARFVYLDPVVLQRPGPRVLSAVAGLCEAIDAARSPPSAGQGRPAR